MASRANEEETSENSDAPLIDLNDASVKKLLAKAKRRGFLTYDELNAALPQDQMNSEQIEDVMSAISEMGVNIVESDEDGEEKEEVEEEVETIDNISENDPRSLTNTIKKPVPASAPMILFACICAKWARSSSSAAKAKSRLPSVSRRAVTR